MLKKRSHELAQSMSKLQGFKEGGFIFKDTYCLEDEKVINSKEKELE